MENVDPAKAGEIPPPLYGAGKAVKIIVGI
jgi:hypothetical protein